MNVIVVGGSRHIGYFSALRLLDQGASVTFLLRNPSTFDEDSAIQDHVESGKARLLQGDALIADDVQRLWNEASKEQPVDLVLISVGFTGSPTFSLKKGFVISPANLVTQALLTVVCNIPPGQSPKLVVISASGVSKTSRQKVPMLLKPVYGWMIQSPLADKLGAERVVAHCAGWDWDPTDGEPIEEVLGSGWQDKQGLPGTGSLKNSVVLRPAWLTDGECLGDAAAEEGKALPYRAGTGEVSGYTISRKDVAHFIAEGILKDWERWGGKQLSIAY